MTKSRPKKPCKECGGAVRTIDTRTRESGITKRRRGCISCGRRESTYEVPASMFNILIKSTAIERLRVLASSILNAVQELEDLKHFAKDSHDD